MQATHAESYFIFADNKKVGGCILNINKETNKNSIDFLFINKGMDGKNLGGEIWLAIENRYPQTKRWTTATPYFETRNIHFYINKCKFQAVKFTGPHFQDPDCKKNALLQQEYFFYFEKNME